MRWINRSVYWAYAAGRRVLRTMGLIEWVRPLFAATAAQWVYRAATNGNRPVVIHGHRMLLAPPDAYASPDMTADRYEPETTRLFERLVKPGQVVFDIGAHVGYYTLLAARLVGDAGRVYAFEPEPKNFALLQQNITLNGYRNVIAVNEAVTDSCGPRELFLSGLDNGFHSLFQLKLRQDPNPRGVSIDATTLDAFTERLGWPRIDVIKMDIEGGETAAFQGMERLLERSPALSLVLEFCPWILQTLGTEPTVFLQQLRGMGFRVHVIAPQGAVPLEELDVERLLARLLRVEGYANLLCMKAGAAQPSAGGSVPTHFTESPLRQRLLLGWLVCVNLFYYWRVLKPFVSW